MLKSAKETGGGIDAFLGQNTSFNGTLVFEGVVKISGRFDGLVVAKNKVELYKPAFVTGTIRTPVIKMEEGVIINGTLEMDNGRNKPLTGKKEE